MINDVLLIDNSIEQNTLLVPVVTVQPDLVTQTDVVVYVPLASKTAHGVVKIGDGLNITPSGILSLDVGIIQDKLDELNTNLTDEILDVDDRLTLHINDVHNPHKVTKEQVGLSNVDNTSDDDKPISTATQRELQRIENMVSGARGALVYANYSEMVDALNADRKKMWGIGQSIFIKTKEVPDLWIYEISDDYVEYSYVDDEQIEILLEHDGTLQIGYYVLSALESNEIKLDNVVTTDTTQTITGRKTFTSLAVKPSDNSTFTLDEVQLRYINTIEENSTQYIGLISVTPRLVNLQVSGDYGNYNVLLNKNGFTFNDSKILTEKDATDFMSLSNIQTVTGTKIFTEQIGILNGNEGEINFIKHINNNFLISSSDGENIVNIDEQLKTFNFYNKPLALEEYVDNNFISFTKQQTLSEDQKQIARNNIGAGTDDGGAVDLSNYVTLTTEQIIIGNKTINAEFEVNSTAEDYSKTSHLVVSQNMIQLMNQDLNSNGGSFIITPQGGVQVAVSGNSIFTYNGKQVATIDDIPSDTGSSIEIDGELSETSENPVQNKLITLALSNKVDKVNGKNLSTNDYTTAEKTKLAGLSNYDDTEIKNQIANKVDKVSGKDLSTNDYTTAEKNKLNNLSNYDDTEIKNQLGNKVDKVSGKGLSTNDYTTTEKNKLAGISEGANKTTVDTSLSTSSTNPVQNKLVTTALNSKEAVSAKSLGANGYVKYASGLIIQWGTFSGSYTMQTNLATPFTTTNYVVIVTLRNSAVRVYAEHIVEKQTSYFKSYSDDSRTMTRDYIAIGY